MNLKKGLITRLGEWLDEKFTAKALWTDVLDQDSKCSARHIGCLAAIAEARALLAPINAQIEEIKTMVAERSGEKDLHDLKTRLEKIELYSGMTRKVDPTKPPVVKTAFQM